MSHFQFPRRSIGCWRPIPGLWHVEQTLWTELPLKVNTDISGSGYSVLLCTHPHFMTMWGKIKAEFIPEPVPWKAVSHGRVDISVTSALQPCRLYFCLCQLSGS